MLGAIGYSESRKNGREVEFPWGTDTHKTLTLFYFLMAAPLDTLLLSIRIHLKKSGTNHSYNLLRSGKNVIVKSFSLSV